MSKGGRKEVDTYPDSHFSTKYIRPSHLIQSPIKPRVKSEERFCDGESEGPLPVLPDVLPI